MTAQQIKSQNNTMRDRKINKPLNRRQNYKNSVPCACAMRTAVRIRRSTRTRILSADEHTTQEITHFSHCLHVLIQQTCLHQQYINTSAQVGTKRRVSVLHKVYWRGSVQFQTCNV